MHHGPLWFLGPHFENQCPGEPFVGLFFLSFILSHYEWPSCQRFFVMGNDSLVHPNDFEATKKKGLTFLAQLFI